MRPTAPRREPEAIGLIEAIVRRLRGLGGRDSDAGSLREALENLIEEQEEGDQLGEDARELVRNALSFADLRVDDVMVPRADIKAVPVEATLPEVVAALRASGHSRLVVYRGSLDDVVGVIAVRDLLPFWGDGAEFVLERVMRPILIVPPSMRVLDLLIEMRAKRSQMAVVVDEFGGTDGLVTLEDMLEEIVGELSEEQDKNHEPQLVVNADGTLDADARYYLEDLEDRLGLELLDAEERDEVDTLGGLIFHLLDRVPAKGEIVAHPSGLRLEVLEAGPRRVGRVRIHPVPSAEGVKTRDG
jgi:CBS domain containing-hemolysin-like protein